jgi:hypothetical protein
VSNHHPLLTDLELRILVAMQAGRDPYDVDRQGVVSQAIGRLERKAFLESAQGRRVLTDYARRVLSHTT